MKLSTQILNFFRIIILTFFSFIFANTINAASKEEIDIQVKGSLQKFQEEVTGGKEFLEKAEGV
ncbi:MAG: hypothetical protein GTO02_02265, partial [Candidatus Dadabacteria bacterium]|nr:hypothetical protein [Candidatus Dadabacteria bacterium]